MLAHDNNNYNKYDNNNYNNNNNFIKITIKVLDNKAPYFKTVSNKLLLLFTLATTKISQ